MALSAGARIGPYEVIAPLGAGGMGEVYRARDPRLERDVAIKVLPSALASDPEFRERFEREARAVAALNHPHICTIHDVGRHDPSPGSGQAIDYFVMEFSKVKRLPTGSGPKADRRVRLYGSRRRSTSLSRLPTPSTRRIVPASSTAI